MRKYQTIEAVSHAVNAISLTQDTEAAAQLLFELYQEGQLYYVESVGDPLLVYSHQELAQESAMPADGVDFLALAVKYYLSGEFCVVLNATASALGLSIPIRGFMEHVHTDLLQYPEGYCATFADDVEALLSLKGQSNISVARQPNGITFLIWEHGVETEKLPKKSIIEQCDFVRMIELVSECKLGLVRIYTQRGMIDTTSRAILATFHACQIPDNAVQRSGLDLISLATVDADYEFADKLLNKQIESGNLPPVAEQVPISSKLKNFVSKFRKKKDSTVEKGLADIEEAANQSTSQKKFPAKTASACIFATLFTVIAIFIIWWVLTPTPLETVQEDIRTGSYETLLENYNNCIASNPDNKEILLSLMSADLDEKVAGYAANTVTTEEIAKVLVTYQKIPAMKDKANEAYHTASALEQSKIAYRKGLAAKSIFTRLTYWRSVTKNDIGSNASMVENLATNAELYKKQAFEEIRGQNDKTALSNLYLFQSFYANDEEVSALITELQNRAFSTTTTDSDDIVGIVGAQDIDPRWDQAPIVISKFTIKQVGFEGWNTIYLDWGNRTEKEISSVVFEIYPYDHAGNCLTTMVDTGDGLYSKYQAKFEGPFASGQMVQGCYFPKVWCNANIVSARVDAVIITYADGTIATFFNSSEVAGLFAK